MRAAAKILVLVAGIAICASSGCQTVDNHRRSMVDMIKHFDENGLKADEIRPSLAKAIKAEEGCQLSIDGANIEIYKYNIKDPLQAAALEQIRKDGFIQMFTIKFKIKVNGSFVMIHGDAHPDNVRIIEVFESFR